MLFQTLAFVTFALAPGAVAARAGAYVKGCVYLPSAPSSPMTFTFSPGSSSDQNMNPKGYQNSVSVFSWGITCADVGYVQEDSTFQEARWTLGYSGGPHTGSTESVWSASFWNNEVNLKKYDAQTCICGSLHLCNQKDIKWDQGTTGPIYIIFTPNLPNSASFDGIQQQNEEDL
ncbi:hypothetical protein FALBO_12867 [Fusarium albosuccineum]|uniref:Uncharacterized protein n=1 Tax=Fusarium albosuccineum TaxID=1237068 RepID=A0A8H4PGT9_9HYPO|nr:hypothetical protein FALBO_12867 [Fusarium albosuccineum]